MGEIIEQDGRRFFKGKGAVAADITAVNPDVPHTLENFCQLPQNVRNAQLQEIQDKAETAVQLARESQAMSSIECKKRLDLLRDRVMPELDKQLMLAIKVTSEFLENAQHGNFSPTTAMRHISRVRKAVKDHAEVEKVLGTPPIVAVEKPGGGKVNVNVGAGVYMGGKGGTGKGSTGGRY
jgi:hypothetical protein